VKGREQGAFSAFSEIDHLTYPSTYRVTNEFMTTNMTTKFNQQGIDPSFQALISKTNKFHFPKPTLGNQAIGGGEEQ
jgi:hypothetical protein